MRVVHVVTHLSSTGAFGGPSRVALDIANAQQKKGHQALVVGAGSETMLDSLDGAGVKIFGHVPLPGLGFAGWTSPKMLAWISKALKQIDVLHIHLSRDLITLPIAVLARIRHVPYVLHTHGMVDQSDKLFAKLIDQIATKTALRGAGAVFALTRAELSELTRLGASKSTTKLLTNGLPENALASSPGERSPNILFLARLHPRKRAADFVRAAVAVAKQDPDFSFTVAGPDEGSGGEAKELATVAVLRDRIYFAGPLTQKQVRDAYDSARVYVLPAPHEPFGLTVIEALARGTPVVVHETAELAPLILKARVGTTFDGSIESLSAAMVRVASDPDYSGLQSRAIAFVRHHFSLDAISDRIEQEYSRIHD